MSFDESFDGSDGKVVGTCVLIPPDLLPTLFIIFLTNSFPRRAKIDVDLVPRGLNFNK